MLKAASQVKMATQQSERIPMLIKSTSDESLLTHLTTHQQQQKYYDVRPSSTPNGSTNGIIINNYAINSNSTVVTRCLCYLMKGVQRNIQKCVAGLVLISFFSIIFFTQYMDSPALVGWVFKLCLSIITKSNEGKMSQHAMECQTRQRFSIY